MRKDTPELITKVFELYQEHVQGHAGEDLAPLSAYLPKTQTRWAAYANALAEFFAVAPPASMQIHGRAYPGVAPPPCDIHSVAGLYVDDGRWCCELCERDAEDDA